MHGVARDCTDERRRRSALSNAILQSSATPRTASRIFACDGAGGMDRHAHLYAQAQAALSRANVAAALALFERCPDDYRNTQSYRTQCAMWLSLYEQGIVLDDRQRDLRRVVANSVGGEECDEVVARYARRLHDSGFSAAAVEASSVRLVDAIASAANFSEGHRRAFALRCRERSSWHECALYDAACGLRACLHEVVACRRAAKAATLEPLGPTG